MMKEVQSEESCLSWVLNFNLINNFAAELSGGEIIYKILKI